MAFTIKIYEKDEYIYSLLRKRLSCFFPDAYITDPYIVDQDLDDRFSDYTRVLYDPSDISENDITPTTSTPIRLTEDGGIIDCARIVSFLNTQEDAPMITKPATGTLTAVVPFVYSDVRDRFISNLQIDKAGGDFNIRLDFTSKIRALWGRSACSNMTSLLEACTSRKFVPEDILKYCNIDDSGFLTPGSCKENDDVYDLGINRSIALMNHAADLAHSNIQFVNILAVIEGFKSKDLPELLSGCDKVYILLPAKNSGEDIGTRGLISTLTGTLGQERISVAYAEDFEYGDIQTLSRRMAV